MSAIFLICVVMGCVIYFTTVRPVLKATGVI